MSYDPKDDDLPLWCKEEMTCLACDHEWDEVHRCERLVPCPSCGAMNETGLWAEHEEWERAYDCMFGE